MTDSQKSCTKPLPSSAFSNLIKSDADLEAMPEAVREYYLDFNERIRLYESADGKAQPEDDKQVQKLTVNISHA
jgi:hypothetical protein